jgi:hypothetical protein
MKLLVLAGIAWLSSCAFTYAKDDICPNGAMYGIGPWGDKTVVVKRVGIGKSAFAPDGALVAGMALDVVADNGEKLAFFGQTRFSMFLTTLQYLTEQRYEWSPAPADPHGSYIVHDRDGEALATLIYVHCAP